MDEMLARERFSAGRVARFATVRPDGRPHVVPIVFAADGDVVYSIVDAKPKGTRELVRLSNIRGNPRVSMLVDHYEEGWEDLWWVRVDGMARLEDDGPRRERAIDLLTAKYPQYAGWDPGFGTAVVIEIAAWRSWSYS